MKAGPFLMLRLWGLKPSAKWWSPSRQLIMRKLILLLLEISNLSLGTDIISVAWSTVGWSPLGRTDMWERWKIHGFDMIWLIHG